MHVLKRLHFGNDQRPHTRVLSRTSMTYPKTTKEYLSVPVETFSHENALLACKALEQELDMEFVPCFFDGSDDKIVVTSSLFDQTYPKTGSR